MRVGEVTFLRVPWIVITLNGERDENFQGEHIQAATSYKYYLMLEQ